MSSVKNHEHAAMHIHTNRPRIISFIEKGADTRVFVPFF